LPTSIITEIRLLFNGIPPLFHIQHIKEKSVVSFYELQERTPSPAILVKLATVFHVSTDFLLGIDNVERLDVSGLTQDDIKVVSLMIDTLRQKNQK